MKTTVANVKARLIEYLPFRPTTNVINTVLDFMNGVPMEHDIATDAIDCIVGCPEDNETILEDTLTDIAEWKDGLWTIKSGTNFEDIDAAYDGNYDHDEWEDDYSNWDWRDCYGC